MDVLQTMQLLSESLHNHYVPILVFSHKSCSTPCDPMDCNPPGSSVLGILQAKRLEWVAIFFSRGPSQSRDQPYLLHLQVDSLPMSHQGSQGSMTTEVNRNYNMIP